MAGFGAYILAGAADGLGEGLVERAKTLREERLDELRRRDRRNERMEDRQWKLEDRQFEIDREERHAGELGDFFQSIYGNESGGRFDADNRIGYTGRGQFGQDRLDDFTSSLGVGRITPQQFKKDPGLQENVEAWHWDDIQKHIAAKGYDQLVGKKINGTPITMSGLMAVAHLGGKNGLDRFVKSGGEYNPSDKNGTSLTDYFRKHGGKTVDMARYFELMADPQTGPGQRAALEQAVEGFGVSTGKADRGLTGEEWIPDGNGNLVLHGRDGRGRMVPYQTDKGEPVTKPESRSKTSTKVSEGAKYRIRRALEEKLGIADDAQVDVVAEEVLRLMRDEGMSETEAERSAVDRMDINDIEFTGGFGPLASAAPATSQPGLGAAPQTAQASPAAQQRPTGPGPAPERSPRPAAPPRERNERTGMAYAPASNPKPTPAPTTPTPAPRSTGPAFRVTLPQDPAKAKPPTPAEVVKVVEEARRAIARNVPRAQVEARLRQAGIDPALLDQEVSPQRTKAVLDEARAAIAAGANRKAVEQRVTAMGIDPRDL